MPIVSGGGGGGGNTTAQVVASGKVLPVADASGVTVDSTTYADPIAGGGAKLTTLVWGSIRGLLAVAKSGDAFPRWLWSSDAKDGFYFGSGAFDPYVSGPLISTDNSGSLILSARSGASITTGSAIAGQEAVSSDQVPLLRQLSPLFSTIAGALSTVQLVTATGAQISTTRDVETVTPCTFNPGAATTATVTVAVSPDNVTYSTLGVETEPAGVAFDGTIHLVKVRVPAGWYLKLTVNAQAVLGLTTFY